MFLFFSLIESEKLPTSVQAQKLESGTIGPLNINPETQNSNHSGSQDLLHNQIICFGSDDNMTMYGVMTGDDRSQNSVPYFDPIPGIQIDAAIQTDAEIQNDNEICRLCAEKFTSKAQLIRHLYDTHV